MANVSPDAGRFPAPRTSCPSAVVTPAVAAVFAAQAVLVAVLLFAGFGLPTAVGTAVGLLVIDLATVASRAAGLREILVLVARWSVGGAGWSR